MENRNGRFRIKLHYQGKYYSRSLKTTNQQKADLAKSQIERNLELVSLGLLQVPERCDIFDFFLTGNAGSPTQEKVEKSEAKTPTPDLTFQELFDLYFEAFLKESIEENSYGMLQTHRRNLLKIIGCSVTVASFQTEDIQRYIDKRAKEKGKRGCIQPVTIRKEITTLTAIFEWAVETKKIGSFPETKSLRYPKGKEKPPFQTWDEIERKVSRGGLSDDAVAELWECLFLNAIQIEDFLAHAKKNAPHKFMYPALVFAAHTGARRSEVARSQLSDIDFEVDMITIRELKRVRGMESTRRVPMSPFLKSVLTEWIDNHPGGQMTFCMRTDECRYRNQEKLIRSITTNQLHLQFTKTIESSKWKVLHGWHTLRHSFCSNCAAAGVEQRIINDWVGHQTDAMVRRYRHLFPNKQQHAIQLVFGSNSV